MTTRPTSERPRAAAAGGEPAADALARLRRFHLGAPDAPAGGVPPGAVPAALEPFRGAAFVRTDFPLFLGPPEVGEGALCLGFTELLERALRTLEGERAPAGPALRDNLGRLERAVAERLAAGARDAREALAEAGAAMTERLELAPEARLALGDDLARLVAAVPEGGDLLAAGPGAPLALLGHALAARRHGPRQAFAREARELAGRVEALLESERLKGPAGRDAARLGGAMGRLADRYVDSAALAGVLGEPRGAVALDGERVRRLEEALEQLRAASDGTAARRPVLVHDGMLPWAAATAPSNGGEPWAVIESSDPCAVALEIFDREAWYAARLLLAARRARLETTRQYDPERHDLLLDGDGPGAAALDWQAFSRDELALLPPVVVVESASQLAVRDLQSLSRLLLSGRPVQVLVVDDPAADPMSAPGERAAAETFAGFRFQPAYLGLALREAFVQQGSTSRPLDLAAGFLRAAGGARAALHVVDLPAAVPDLPAAVVAGAAVEGRAHPLFHYDPEAGASWAQRLDFSGNPAAEEDWPSHEGVPFTFADYALLAPELAGHFLAVPDGVPAAALATLPEWLALDPQEALERVPHVLAALAGPGPGGGRTTRFAVSRRLALACRDRLAYWRTLQELAGVNSEYVRRAEARARESADARVAAERERLEAAHAAELERVRRQAAEQVVNRLTTALLGVDLGGEPLLAAGPLGGFAGRDVDDVSAALREMAAGVDPEAADPDGGRPSGAAVDAVVSELLAMVGAIDPEAPEAAAGQTRSDEP